MLGIDFLDFWPPLHLILEAHVGGVVEVGRILGAWSPSRGCLDLHYTSFGSSSALNVGNIPVMKDKIASVFTTLMTWASRSTVEGLVGTFAPPSPLPLLLHWAPSPFPGPSSLTKALPPLPGFGRLVQRQKLSIVT